MSQITEELRRAAIEAFHAYEEIYIARVVKKEGWRMDASSVEDVLATNDPDQVEAFIHKMSRERASLIESATIL